MFDDLLRHRSGRVIALARIVLASVFLFAIWIDPRQPVQATTEVYTLLAAYLAGTVVVALVTWSNWWWDARLAAPVHVADIGLFALLVLASDGYTSPFFVFFVFLLLSAAIRWGWRQTAITAAAVIAVFLAMGLFASNPTDPSFDLQRFIIRSANLVILSALLIWFGTTHGFSLATIGIEPFGEPDPDDDPLETAAETAARVSGATAAALLWLDTGSSDLAAIKVTDGGNSTTGLGDWQGDLPSHAFLFDLSGNRALRRNPDRGLKPVPADTFLPRDVQLRLGISQGLAVPVATDTGRGLLLLGGIQSPCTDHIDIGETLGSALSRQIQRHALIAAVKEGAIARARLSLARDLHDSIVQFLAGATFRVEAISRALKAGGRPEEELSDLKQLLLQEQQELRSAIGALRREMIALPTLARDLEALCGRLSKQWDISCAFSADVPEHRAPMRLHLDAHQLVREAIANAVRHASAKSVTVAVSVENRDLRLDISNDGHGHDKLREGDPWSLRERVDEANGSLMLASHSGGTSVSITLPLKGSVPRDPDSPR